MVLDAGSRTEDPSRVGSYPGCARWREGHPHRSKVTERGLLPSAATTGSISVTMPVATTATATVGSPVALSSTATIGATIAVVVVGVEGKQLRALRTGALVDGDSGKNKA